MDQAEEKINLGRLRRMERERKFSDHFRTLSKNAGDIKKFGIPSRTSGPYENLGDIKKSGGPLRI